MSIIGHISTKEHYGLRLVINISKSYYTKEPVSLYDVSTKEKISMKYLEQIIIPLKKSGLVESVRGRSGGYIMKKNPNAISLKEVLYLLSSDEKDLVACLAPGSNYRCPIGNKCLSKKAWKIIQDSINRSLSSIKLSKILK